MSESRALHKREIVSRSEATLAEEIEARLEGDILVIAPNDDRLNEYLPVEGQLTLGGPQIDLPESAETHYGDLPEKREDDSLPYDSESFDTVLSLFSLMGYFQRMIPFQEATSVVRPHGTIIQATGLQPQVRPDHDAKYWASNSDTVELTEIIATRSDGFKTPEILMLYDRLDLPYPRDRD